ncbi:Uncharacterized protein FKW44_011014 [Caligus rogercresseyi]|uniref:Uncharacterized protein n=1 Tax=Caligus rogercresseyi TaxID=217165 RepID=A0A7T8HHF3_CALRO|nr:Uncharacterized protein FKW44_011014 [Caligus rogercresseyi]
MFPSLNIIYFLTISLCSSFVIYHLLAEIPSEEPSSSSEEGLSPTSTGEKTIKRLEKRLAELETKIFNQHLLDEENSLKW